MRLRAGAAGVRYRRLRGAAIRRQHPAVVGERAGRHGGHGTPARRLHPAHAGRRPTAQGRTGRNAERWGIETGGTDSVHGQTGDDVSGQI